MSEEDRPPDNLPPLPEFLERRALHDLGMTKPCPACHGKGPPLYQGCRTCKGLRFVIKEDAS